MADQAFYRQYILETCQWLFDKEVRIVLFMDGLNTSNTYTTHHGMIIPKDCSIKSLSQCDVNERILLHAHENLYGVQTNQGLYLLFLEVQRRTSEIFKIDSGGKRYTTDKSKIPGGKSGQILPRIPLEDDNDMNAENEFGDVTVKRIRKSQTPVTKDSPESMGPRSSLEIADEERRKNLRERIAKLAALTTRISGDDPCEPEASASTPSITPCVSCRSGSTTPAVERERVLELNRKIIREELNLAIRGIFGSFAEHMKGD